MKIIADSAIPFLQGRPRAVRPRCVYLPGVGDFAPRGRPRRRRPPDPHPHPLRRAAARRIRAYRLIATATIGFDHIDTAWCAAHGIRRHARPPAATPEAYCNGSAAVLRPPLPHAGLAARRAHAGSRRRGTRRIARESVCRSVGIPRRLLRPAARGARAAAASGRWRRWPARPTSSPSTRRSTLRRAAWPTTPAVRPDETRRRHHKLLARRGGRRRGPAPQRPRLGVLDVWEHEPRHRSAGCWQARCSPHPTSRATPSRARPTPRQCPSPRWPAVSACRSKGGIRHRPPRRAGGRSPGRNFAGPSAGAYDIASESRSLKERPGDFESMRDHYAYRREYF